jgi:DNA alkylation repair enzyme
MAGSMRAADDLEAGLRAIGTPERAAHEQRYLKSDLEHLGATVWQIRREVKSFAEQHPALSHAELVQLVDALWAKPAHERRMAKVLVLEVYPELVEPSDLPLLERLVRESKTWVERSRAATGWPVAGGAASVAWFATRPLRAAAGGRASGRPAVREASGRSRA